MVSILSPVTSVTKGGGANSYCRDRRSKYCIARVEQRSPGPKLSAGPLSQNLLLIKVTPDSFSSFFILLLKPKTALVYPF